MASLKSTVSHAWSLQWRMRCCLAFIMTAKVFYLCSRRYKDKRRRASNTSMSRLTNRGKILLALPFNIRCQSIWPNLRIVLSKITSLYRRVEGSPVWLQTAPTRRWSISQRACATTAITGTGVKATPLNANTLRGWTTRKGCAKTATSTHTIKKRDWSKKSRQSPNSTHKS